MSVTFTNKEDGGDAGEHLALRKRREIVKRRSSVAEGGAIHAFCWTLLPMSEARELACTGRSSDANWGASVGTNGIGEIASYSGDALNLEESTQGFVPAVFPYDNYPGATGLTGSLFDLKRELVAWACELVNSCGSRLGCPA